MINRKKNILLPTYQLTSTLNGERPDVFWKIFGLMIRHFNVKQTHDKIYCTNE